MVHNLRVMTWTESAFDWATEFDQTLALYIQGMLAEPDESLIAYQVIGEERLAEFAKALQADPRRDVGQWP